MKETPSPAVNAGRRRGPGPAVDLGALLREGECLPEVPVRIPLPVLRRHGLVTGAVAAGRTRTVQLMAERLSAHGVPVLLTDPRGDLTGIGAPGTGGGAVERRAAELGEEWVGQGFPTEYYAFGGVGTGIPLRATVTGFGPALLSRALGLDAARERTLDAAFRYADAAGLDLTGPDDLRSVLARLPGGEGAAEPPAVLGRRGTEPFFGEPEFDVRELPRTAPDGRGVVSVLRLPARGPAERGPRPPGPAVSAEPGGAAVREAVRLGSAVAMWLLAGLARDLADPADPAKPRLVCVLDTGEDGWAGFFRDAPQPFVAAVADTLRLLREKGVAVFLVTRSADELPPEVLGQLGHRVRHAPGDGAPGDAGAPGAGEAVVTVLDETGGPAPAATVRTRPPQSLTGPLDAGELARVVAASPLRARYAQGVDNGRTPRTGPAVSRSVLGTARRRR